MRLRAQGFAPANEPRYGAHSKHQMSKILCTGYIRCSQGLIYYNLRPRKRNKIVRARIRSGDGSLGSAWALTLCRRDAGQYNTPSHSAVHHSVRRVCIFFDYTKELCTWKCIVFASMYYTQSLVYSLLNLSALQFTVLASKNQSRR